MSKILDEMRARYTSPRKSEALRKARIPMRKPGAPAACRPVETPETVIREDRHLVRSPFLKTSHRYVEGLDWTNIEGVDVLRLAGQYTNYVASPHIRPVGTFAIFRLKPRSIVVQRIKTKDVLHQIERLIQQDEESLVREKKYRQEVEEKERAEARRLEHQPGFYIIPGEIMDGEGDDPVPIGPYWMFERAHSRYEGEDFVRDEDSRAGDLDDDVEDDALALMRSLQEEERKGLFRERKLSPVEIIESPNRKAAARRQGHVWWSDGVFRGPPVDPRQSGWGW
jgi:hypothetical protein